MGVKGSATDLWTRRDFLSRSGGGLGMVALSHLLQQEGLSAGTLGSGNPLLPHVAHVPAKAKAVIWLFMNGGPSHVDTWDYKPELAKFDGKAYEGFDKETGFFSKEVGPLMKSPWAFQKYGESGAWVSDLFPHLSQHVDKMAFIKSLYAVSNNHSPALFMMNTGVTKMGHPCAGAWINYGLGSESQDLPSFVVMSDPLNRGLPKGHALNWGSGFLPGVFQGTWIRSKGDAVENVRRLKSMSDAQQQDQLRLIHELNEFHKTRVSAESELSARIHNFELAYRMQTAMPEALDLGTEPESVRKLYGLDETHCGHFAKQCLNARRMVERGVRFVQIYSGGMANDRSWDGHKDIVKNHGGFARETDQPIAGLLADLEMRGMLDETLVIWGGEFGRLPVSQRKAGAAVSGRDHNPEAMTFWLAGGGVKAGVEYGATDELGHRAVKDRVHVNDLHATVLRLMGLDHKKLTYLHNGRRMRLTDVGGKVISELIA